MNSFVYLTTRLRHLAAALLLLAVPLVSIAAEQRSFATPEAAVQALHAALKANDEAALISIFGDQHKNLVGTGDAANDAVVRAEAAALLSVFHTLTEPAPDRRVLLLGPHAWPLPIPLVRQGGAWRFASEEGVEEMINRRIGANERSAIEVLRAYVQAQRDYASRDRDGDGVLQYARKLQSAPGKFDGLHWIADASKGEEASPFGPLIGRNAPYLEGHKRGDPYRGYNFRILTSQGKNAAGGAFSYLINGRMIAGFAMIAYPDAYDETGVTSFVINQNGTLFEKDLGRNTVAIAEKMVAFDPGPGWKALPPP